MTKWLPLLLLIVSFLVMAVAVVDKNVVTASVHSLESAVYFVGSVLSYLMIKINNVQGDTNGSN